MSFSGVRLGLIGFGQIAQKHLEVFRAHGTFIAASVNRSEEGRGRARAAGIPRIYAEPETMIENDKPDGVLVCTSVMSLFDTALRVLPYGLPVLLEKPPGTSLEECQKMAELAGRWGTPVMVGLNRRFYSVYHRALEELGGREALTAVSVEWSEDPVKMVQLGHPPELLPLLNYANSLHGIDLLTFFAGEIPIPSVWGRNLDLQGKRYRWQMSLDGISRTGIKARFDSNWDVPGRWRLVLDAQDARLVSAPLETGQLFVRGKPAVDIRPSEEDLLFKPGFYGQARSFLQMITEGAPVQWPACSLEDAALSMGLAEAGTSACRVSGGAT